MLICEEKKSRDPRFYWRHSADVVRSEEISRVSDNGLARIAPYLYLIFVCIFAYLSSFNPICTRLFERM